MPDLKEKLVELLDEKQIWGIDQEQPRKHDIMLLENEELADHLIANGVTIQEWISVKDDIPPTHEETTDDFDGDICYYQLSDPVLGCTADGTRVIVKLEISDEKHWWVDENGTTYSITDWMPLPASTREVD